jgi:hypothetical protein
MVDWTLRPPSPSSPYPLAPMLIMGVGNQVSTHIFYPGDSTVAGQLHQAATFGLSLTAGVALAHWFKRSRAGSIEPPPVIREGQYLP